MPQNKLPKSIHSPPYSRFLRLIKEARINAGLTQIDAARGLGKSQSFISKCESGERRVDVVEFIALCQLYAVDPSTIVRMLTETPK